MRKLLVLVGVQGSGKTTALQAFTKGKVLKPSTTRPKRFPAEDEYHFEKQWTTSKFAWTIKRGSNSYGMRWAELQAIDRIGITVFDPAALGTLKASPANREFEIVTVGLDTLATHAEQNARVAADPNRTMSAQDFEDQRKVVLGCDIVLRGDAKAIATAVDEVATILGSRGGVLNAASISKLLAAGSLLDQADPTRVEPASYDLRISDQYWCQGRYHTLSDENPVATIPPYSFALVKAKEEARLPSFIVGTFDIRVSLFFQGVVLSNGPQVDPGYSGALFCMLHNASGSEVGINRGDHFATIQFQTMATNSVAYSSQYQNKKGFTDFLDGSSSKKPGGQIFEHVNSISQKLADDFRELRNLHYTISGVALAAIAVAGGIGVWMVDKSATAASDRAAAAATTAAATAAAAENAASNAIDRLAATQKRLDEVLDKLSKETRIKTQGEKR